MKYVIRREMEGGSDESGHHQQVFFFNSLIYRHATAIIVQYDGMKGLNDSLSVIWAHCVCFLKKYILF